MAAPTQSRKDENRARPRSLSPPLKRRRRRKTRSTVSACCWRKARASRPNSAPGSRPSSPWPTSCSSATRSGLRVHFRRALLCAVALALARLADRRSPDEFEARHRRRHRTRPRSDRTAKCRHRRRRSRNDLSKPQALLAAAGFLVIASLATRKVPVAIIIGVLGVTLVAVAFGLEPWHGLAARRPRSRRPSLR